MASTRPVLNFITGNANKLAEVKAILEGPAGIEVRNQPLDLPEIQGELEDVTREKCRVAADLVGGPVLVEDTCLCFNALGGLPGPYIKWFMRSIGHEGLNNLLAAYDDKSAQAVATFGFSKGPGQEVLLFQGRTDVSLVFFFPRAPPLFFVLAYFITPSTMSSPDLVPLPPPPTLSSSYTDTIYICTLDPDPFFANIAILKHQGKIVPARGPAVFGMYLYLHGFVTRIRAPSPIHPSIHPPTTSLSKPPTYLT